MQVEAEQTLADTDQTLSDADQTGADADQRSADSDQLASNLDQAASDRDLQHGVPSSAHDLSRDMRQRTTRRRRDSAQARVEAAAQRDAVADSRDLAARARDQAAEARDLAMAQRDAANEPDRGPRTVTGAEIVMRAAEQRRRAAEHREQAAVHRGLAALDRQEAARDREQAADERCQAATDRAALARQLASAETDPLTGTRTRAAGLTDLEHELDRCRRSDGLLVVAYVDVIGLKAVNDADGHAAGDELLQRVVALIRQHLRTYDLIIRLGGDEFLCAMSNTTLSDARKRFGALTATPGAAPIRTGLAQLAPEETVTQLIQRADSEMIGMRLPELSQIEPAKIDGFERRHHPRATVRDRISSLFGR